MVRYIRRGNLLGSPLDILVVKHREYKSEQPAYRNRNPHTYTTPKARKDVCTWNAEQPKREKRYKHGWQCIAGTAKQSGERKHSRKQKVERSAYKQIPITFVDNRNIRRKTRHNTV